MNLAVWHKQKASAMEEIRKQLKKHAAPGEPTLSRKEANRTWREEILGVLSEEQRKEIKAKRQQTTKKHFRPKNEDDDTDS
jgi:hypothetical protein